MSIVENKHLIDSGYDVWYVIFENIHDYKYRFKLATVCKVFYDLSYRTMRHFSIDDYLFRYSKNITWGTLTVEELEVWLKKMVNILQIVDAHCPTLNSLVMDTEVMYIKKDPNLEKYRTAIWKHFFNICSRSLMRNLSLRLFHCWPENIEEFGKLQIEKLKLFCVGTPQIQGPYIFPGTKVKNLHIKITRKVFDFIETNTLPTGLHTLRMDDMFDYLPVLCKKNPGLTSVALTNCTNCDDLANLSFLEEIVIKGSIRPSLKVLSEKNPQYTYPLIRFSGSIGQLFLDDIPRCDCLEIISPYFSLPYNYHIPEQIARVVVPAKMAQRLLPDPRIVYTQKSVSQQDSEDMIYLSPLGDNFFRKTHPLWNLDLASAPWPISEIVKSWKGFGHQINTYTKYDFFVKQSSTNFYWRKFDLLAPHNDFQKNREALWFLVSDLMDNPSKPLTETQVQILNNLGLIVKARNHTG